MQERDRFDLADTPHEKLPQATISRLRVRAFSRRRPLLVDVFCRLGAHALPPSGDGWRIVRPRGVTIAVLVTRRRDGCVDFDAGFVELRFFVFIAAVLSIYWSLRSNDYRKWFLLFASYFFYGVWDWRF